MAEQVRWQRGHRSRNLEDRRGRGGLAIGGGLGGILVVAVLYLLGGPEAVEQYGSTVQPSQQASAPDPNDEMASFVGFVLDDAQETWTRIFAARGETYRPARLVLFTGSTQTGCGFGSAAAGPFYCPADQKVYIDLSFYRELKQRFGAPGDFAQAYVIAHEIGHHVQHQLQLLEKRSRAPRDNQLSVRTELQADCFAGIWAHSTGQRELLESGDVEEALAAAAAIGDDRLQRSSGQTINPESWTHGSSEQRMRWFRRGFERGDPNSCDTSDEEGMASAERR